MCALRQCKDTAMIDLREKLPPRAKLSFEDICPRWSLALATGVSNSSRLDIKDARNCIVGEAHGFRSSDYICSKCWEYSQFFVSSVYGNQCSGYMITDHELFESLKDDFLQHFNQKHAYRKGKISTIVEFAQRLLRLSPNRKNENHVRAATEEATQCRYSERVSDSASTGYAVQSPSCNL